MKVNDKKELHAKEASELRKMLKDGHELLLALKLDLQQNKLKNTRSIFNTQKNIANSKTNLKETEQQKAAVKEDKPAASVHPVETAEIKPQKTEAATKRAEK